MVLYVEQTFSLFRSATDFTKTDNVLTSFRNGIITQNQQRIMANATINSPSGIQTRGFAVTVTLDVAIATLAQANVQLQNRTENGATGVTFTITGSGTNWTLTFSVPATAEGSFEIRIVGMVTQTANGSTPEAVMSNSVRVHYDTTANVTAAFGATEYRDDGVVVVPVNFGESVIAPSKSIFAVKHVSGDALTDIEYRLVGENRAFELIFEVPPDRSGSFQVAANGDVFKVSSGVWDNVVITPKTVNYGTLVPRIVDYDIPANYSLSAPVDVRVAFNIRVTGWHVNNTLTEIFIEEGVRLGTPLPYKWTGTSPPDIHAAMPADLTGTDWTLLATPSPGTPTPGANGFDADGQWHGDEGQFFLIRFPDPQATGILNLTLRENAVRGPTGN